MKHFILIFNLCIVGQFINGYSLMGLLRHAIKGNNDEVEHYNMKHQSVKRSVKYGEPENDFDMKIEMINPDHSNYDDDSEVDEFYRDNDKGVLHIVDPRPKYNNYNANGDDSDEENDDHVGAESDEETDGNDDADDDQRDSANNTEKTQVQENFARFVNEMKSGDTADLLGQNQHVFQSPVYMDLGRRFVPQYKYSEVDKETATEHNGDLIPEKAPPELVLVVAKESALLGPDKENNLGDIDQKKILRSGNYWNSFWKEEVSPKTPLRSAPEKKVLGSVKAKIKAGTEFHKVVSRLKKMSPRLLYIINKKLH